jgi:hypothetical protein
VVLQGENKFAIGKVEKPRQSFEMTDKITASASW